MSLAQHVSATEGVDREPLELPDDVDPDYSEAHVIRRVLSYDAFPPSQIEDQADHIPAYKISTTKRAGKFRIVEFSTIRGLLWFARK